MGVSSYLLCAKYSAKMRIKMDKILEKWDEILSTDKHKITHPSASPLTVETLREFYVIRLLYLKIGVIKLAHGTY